MIIFVTLHNGTRYAFVGDLVWQLEGITLREKRPWITRKGSDSDAEGTRENLLRMYYFGSGPADLEELGRGIRRNAERATGCILST